MIKETSQRVLDIQYSNHPAQENQTIWNE